jgi:hypothetical protein
MPYGLCGSPFTHNILAEKPTVIKQKKIRDLRNIHWTIQDGIAKKPEQWME